MAALPLGGKLAVLGALAVGGLVVAAVLPGSSHHRAGIVSAGTSSTAAVTTTSAPPTTVAATTVPATTVDPGTLPQTTQRPSATDPAFLARVNELWQAVVTGRTATGRPAFFPESAYIQVKAISDPVHDYLTRLIANYEQDIQTLHAALGPDPASAVLVGVSVPDAAQWIEPGVEYNKGSYWRVYGTEVNYTVGGRPGSFEIHSMISWRGQWYVVHLGPIR